VYSMNTGALRCNLSVSEMIANKVTIENFRTLGSREALLGHATGLYVQNRLYALLNCPDTVWRDMEIFPEPGEAQSPDSYTEQLNRQWLELELKAKGSEPASR
jgi:hypothetical protein